MGIDVLKPETDAYARDSGGFNVLLTQRPAAVVAPRSAAEMADAVAYAKAEGLRVGAQRTGHSAQPLGDLSGTLLLRTAGLGGVEIDAGKRSARVGAGATGQDLAVFETCAMPKKGTRKGSRPPTGTFRGSKWALYAQKEPRRFLTGRNLAEPLINSQRTRARASRRRPQPARAASETPGPPA